MSVLDDLIYDRTREDLTELRSLTLKVAGGTATADELTKWNAGMKGAVGYTDFKRIRDALIYFQGWLNENGITFNSLPSALSEGEAFTELYATFYKNSLSTLVYLLQYPVANRSPFSIPHKEMKTSDINFGILTYTNYNRLEKLLAECRPNVTFKYKGNDTFYTLYWGKDNVSQSWAGLLNANGFPVTGIETIVFHSFDTRTDTRSGVQSITLGYGIAENYYVDAPICVGGNGQITVSKAIKTAYLYGVKTIKKNAFDTSLLETITIPKTVTTIEMEAFFDSLYLDDIEYEGTMAEWQAITIGYDAFSGVPATVVHCTDGDINL